MKKLLVSVTIVALGGWGDIQAESISAPALHLSVYGGASALGELGYVVCALKGGAKSYIYFGAFDSLGVYYRTVLDSGDVSEPAIAITPKDFLHIVWRKEDRIYYVTTLTGITPEDIRNGGQPVWSERVPISTRPPQRPTEPASNPFVEAEGEWVYVVWRGPNEEGNPNFGEIWQRRRRMDWPIEQWTTPANKSRTPLQESNYPTMSTGIRMKRIVLLPSGADIPSTYVICADTDKDSLNEVIFSTMFASYITIWKIYEHRPMNRYELVYADTGAYPFPPGITTGNFMPWDVGDIDQDGLTDLLGPNIDNPQNPDTNWYNVVTTQESPDYSSYPESLSWWYRYAYNEVISEPFYFTIDLDCDGKKEIIMVTPNPDIATGIWENVGNNQNELVWHREVGAWSFAFNDFDLDGRKEFVTANLGSLGRVSVYENTGDDQYEMIFQDTVRIPNGRDVFSGQDLDGDGKPEFFVCFAWFPGSVADFYLYMWEATGNNTYEKTLLAHLQRNIGLDWGAISKCGDIDGDGIEELVWSIGIDVFVYKAIGNNQFQLVWSWHNPTQDIVKDAFVNIYDLNHNGYNEIVLSGIFGGSPGYPDYATYIYELEAVMLLRPNGGENFAGNTQEPIRWQKFYPPRCDSLSLFYSLDNGRSYDTIITGLPATDSSYLWTVPNVSSDSCRVKIIAYGPGWQYDESDRIFRITPAEVKEEAGVVPLFTDLKVSPNPFHSQTTIHFSLPSEQKVRLKVYNITGKLVRRLCDEEMKPGRYKRVLSNSANEQGVLPDGVYFIRLETDNQKIISKVILTR